MLVPPPPPISYRRTHFFQLGCFNPDIKELNTARGMLGGREGARERINLHVVSRILFRLRHGNTAVPPSVCPSVGCENTRERGGRLFENARARCRSAAEGRTESTQGHWVTFDIQNGIVLNGISLNNCYKSIKVAYAKSCKNKRVQGCNKITRTQIFHPTFIQGISKRWAPGCVKML